MSSEDIIHLYTLGIVMFGIVVAASPIFDMPKKEEDKYLERKKKQD